MNKPTQAWKVTALRPPEEGGVDEGWGGRGSLRVPSVTLHVPARMVLPSQPVGRLGLAVGDPGLESGCSEPLLVPPPQPPLTSPFPGASRLEGESGESPLERMVQRAQ